MNDRGTGKAQYHARMMLSLLVYSHANGSFPSRRIERATCRDLGVRFVTASTHPDHDTIATFRRVNRAAFEAAFVEILMMAQTSGLARVGTVPVDGTRIDANASKIRSVRYDRAQALRARLKADIAALAERAEAADRSEQTDPRALPAEIARREKLVARLDAACTKLEAEAEAQPEFAAKKAAWKARKGRGGRPPVPPDPQPPAERQTNLTDPDSGLMRRSSQHEYRQAYNAQAAVDADGSQLVIATHVTRSPSDAPSFLALVLAPIANGLGTPERILADAGFGDRDTIAAPKARGIDPLVAISRTQPQRPYDFRPPPTEEKPQRETHEPWRIEMKARMQTDEVKAHYRKRRQTVEPVFGTIESAIGFRRFSLRGLAKVATEWTLVTLAYNCRRMVSLGAVP